MAPPKGSTPRSSNEDEMEDDEPMLGLTLRDAFQPRLERRQKRRDELMSQVAPIAQAYERDVNDVLRKMRQIVDEAKNGYEEQEKVLEVEEKRLRGELEKVLQGLQDELEKSLNRVERLLNQDEQQIARLVKGVESVSEAESQEIERRIGNLWNVVGIEAGRSDESRI